MQDEQKQRIYYLDAMRGILMMLGVFVHSAQVFNPLKSWRIHSESPFDFSLYIIDFIHAFRMPAFFIVSGYFCLLTIRRYGASKFLKVRLKRIVIPLIATAVTVNTIQTIILTQTGWKSYTVSEYLLKGEWVSHLWFLNNLIIYFTLAYLATIFLSKIFSKANILTNKLANLVPFTLFMLLLPLPWIMIKIIGKFGFPLYWEFLGVIKMYNLMLFIPYFIFGMWLRANSQQLKNFSNINPLLSIVVIVLCNAVMLMFLPESETLKIIAHEYSHILIAWFSAALCFNLFMRFTNTYSKIFFFLSDASYSVFLFHHMLVIVFGIVLIKYGMGGGMGLLTLICLTTVTSLLIHHYFISKIKFLGFIYNGK